MDLRHNNTVAACNEPIRMELKDPVTKRGLGGFIWVLGRDSTVFQEAMDADADERRVKASEAAQRGEDLPPVLSDEIRAGSIDLLTAAIIGSGKPWENITEDGQPLAFNVPTVKRFLNEYPEFRRQIDRQIAETSDFLKAYRAKLSDTRPLNSTSTAS